MGACHSGVAPQRGLFSCPSPSGLSWIPEGTELEHQPLLTWNQHRTLAPALAFAPPLSFHQLHTALLCSSPGHVVLGDVHVIGTLGQEDAEGAITPTHGRNIGDTTGLGHSVAAGGEWSLAHSLSTWRASLTKGGAVACRGVADSAGPFSPSIAFPHAFLAGTHTPSPVRSTPHPPQITRSPGPPRIQSLACYFPN